MMRIVNRLAALGDKRMASGVDERFERDAFIEDTPASG
jgi:hypothetical protein